MKGWTIVRVWLPKNKNGKFVVAHEAANGGNVGHASLQTKEIYASFWPDWELARKSPTMSALLGEAKGVLMPSPDADNANEGKLPEVVVVLNSLDVKAINDKFNKFAQSSTAKNWSLFGENMFNVFNSGGGQSCSGLVYSLLNAGGIKNLVSWDLVSSTWTVAPDAVARVVVEAAKTQRETALSYSEPLPPGISARVTKPDYDLNPHTNGIGYKMGEPNQGCIMM